MAREGSKLDSPDTSTNQTSNRSLWLFLALAFIPAWTIWFLSGVLPRVGVGAFDYRWLFAQVGAFAPSLAALIVSGLSGKGLRWNSFRILPVLLLPLLIPGLLTARSAPAGVAAIGLLPAVATVLVGAIVILFFSPLNRRLLTPGTGEPQAKPDPRWLFASIVLFPTLFLIAWALANLQGGGWAIAGARNGVPAFVWLVLVSFSHTLLLGGPLGEELGWRGFLLPRLLQRHGPMAASLILAVVWALWHAPIDLTAGFLVQGPGALLARFLWTLPVTILFTWIYLRCRGALLAALFMHASLGMLSDLGFSAFPNSMIIYFLLLAIAAAAVVVADPVFQTRT